jgi:hypothetical protein
MSASVSADLEAQLAHRNHLIRGRVLSLPRMAVQAACRRCLSDPGESVYWLNEVLPSLLERDPRLSSLPSDVLLLPHVNPSPLDVEILEWVQQFLVRSYDPSYVFPSIPYGPPSPPSSP